MVMKHLIWIFTVAALLSFTVVQEYSYTENTQLATAKTQIAQTTSTTVDGTNGSSFAVGFKQKEMRENWLKNLLTDSIVVVPDGFSKTGNVSYYANKFHGRRTSSGAIYHKDSLTAAHKTLKFGTLLRVTNLANDSTVIVKVTDRMGKSPHILDLSYAGAKQLNFIRNGVAKVKIEEIKREMK